MSISSREAWRENELQRNVKAFPHFESNYLKNTFVQNLKPNHQKCVNRYTCNEALELAVRNSYQLNDEGPDEAHHAGPGVPNLRGLGET
jgi:hypothetical protein